MNRLVIVISIWLVFFAGPANSQSPASAAQDEVQVLIDVSGSMKQNDPKNLRIDASKLLISLLAEGSRASIWLFAEKTTPLTKSDAVDAAWKKQALQATSRIHSQGLYTNIEDAIQTVLKEGFKGNGNKHLILLTDGFVDISKDIMVSADSRERVLSEWIPKLQQENIQVETIALSGQADKELLDKLAFDTGGWTESAQSAEQLQRAFLKMVQKAAPKDTLPLTGNQFAVDSEVKEFSVLAFKKPHSAPSQLLTPEQKKINKQTASANVAWLENPAYDLITVKQPGVGDWRLEAETDSDNQVMIVTDLKMQLDELPNFAAEKEAVTLKVHFTDRGKLIIRPDFLDMVSTTVSLDQQAPLRLEAVAGEPGFFVQSFDALEPGKHSFKIVADGKTFKREIFKEIDVVAAPVAVEKSIDPDKREVILKLIPDAALLDIATMTVDASVNRAGKPPETHSIQSEDGVWPIKVDDLAPGSETLINFHVKANTRDGKPIVPEIKPVRIDDDFFLKNAPATPQQKPEPVPVPQSEESHEQKQSFFANWQVVAATVVGVNLLLILCGFLIYRAMKKAQAKKQQELLEKLS
ncbi:MAG: VWA domain-containing protein [Methylomonas sp.]